MEIMTLQDLTKNRDRIIKKAKLQITLCSSDNIKGVMNKMVALLPQYSEVKPTMANLDKLTIRSIELYIKFEKTNTSEQVEALAIALEIKRNQSLPSSLQY